MVKSGFDHGFLKEKYDNNKESQRHQSMETFLFNKFSLNVCLRF